MDELGNIKSLLAEMNVNGKSAIEQIRWLVNENARLLAEAEIGQQYRATLIEEAMVEGIAAQGNGFPEKTYREVFDQAPIETIRSLKDQWKSMADTMLPQGRQTVQTDEKPVEASFDLLNIKVAVPETAYS